MKSADVLDVKKEHGPQIVKEEKKVAPEKGEKKVVQKKETDEKSKTHSMPGILLFPLVTEKGTRLEQQGTYQFAVRNNANKVMVSKAVESRYGIRPTKIRIMHRKGKKTRFGRMFGKRRDWKRALVTLPKGKTIDVHEGV